jgi:hypothetical protein
METIIERKKSEISAEFLEKLKIRPKTVCVSVENRLLDSVVFV